MSLFRSLPSDVTHEPRHFQFSLPYGGNSRGRPLRRYTRQSSITTAETDVRAVMTRWVAVDVGCGAGGVWRTPYGCLLQRLWSLSTSALVVPYVSAEQLVAEIGFDAALRSSIPSQRCGATASIGAHRVCRSRRRGSNWEAGGRRLRSSSSVDEQDSRAHPVLPLASRGISDSRQKQRSSPSAGLQIVAGTALRCSGLWRRATDSSSLAWHPQMTPCSTRSGPPCVRPRSSSMRQSNKQLAKVRY